MRSYKEQALSTVSHGPKGAALLIEMASQRMAEAIEAGDLDAVEKAQADIVYWAESAVFWAGRAADDAKRAHMLAVAA